MFGVEPELLNMVLESRLEEVRVIRSRRASSGVRLRRKRYYKRRKSKIKRVE